MAARSKRLPPGIRRPEWSPDNESLEHFERFAYTLWVPELNERLRLREWQLGPLEDFFAGGRIPDFFQHLWEWPTGQGKSALFGAIVLHHATYCVPLPRVFVIGGEIAHARNTTNAAAGFISESRKRHGLLGAWWESQEHAGGRILPLWLDEQDVGIFAKSAGRNVEAKGGSSVEGTNPTLIVVEEMHRHADGGASVMTLITKTIKAAAVGRDPKVLIGTTAGTNRNSQLGRIEAQVFDEAAGAVVERDRRPGEYYVRAIDADKETVAHIWAVPEKISPPKEGDTGTALDEFLAHVKRANPAEWITVRGLRRVWRSLSRVGRWMFLRQNANQWVTAGFAVLDRGQWWARRRPGLKIPHGPGRRVFVGLDRASKWDSTAIVAVWKPDELWLLANPKDSGKVRAIGFRVLLSPRDGTRRRTKDVGKILESMREAWPDMVIVFDRNAGGGDVAEELEEKHKLSIVDHDQGTAFDLASMRVAELVEQDKLEWDAPDEYRELFAQQVLATVVRATSGGKRWRGEAPDDDTQVDSFDALAMAVNAAETDELPPPAGPRGGPQDYRIEQL